MTARLLPKRDDFARLLDRGVTTPVSRELPADLETPVSAYLKLAGDGGGFLLESVERGEHIGRYSFIGIGPFARFEVRGNEATISTPDSARRIVLEDGDPLGALRQYFEDRPKLNLEGMPPIVGGGVGFFGYDIVRSFEKLPDGNPDELNLPEVMLLFPRTVVAFDHLLRTMRIIHIPLGSDAEAAYSNAEAEIDRVIAALSAPLSTAALEASAFGDGEYKSNFSQGEFEAIVEQAKEHIRAGDIFQAVLSQRLLRDTGAQPMQIYRALRLLNPSPYMFYIDFDGQQLIGSSPEELVKLEGGIASVKPIAGTRPRGATHAEDLALEKELLADEKERAEHVMLVDLGRNDLGRVSEIGSVSVDEMFTIDRYSHVMHIVSSVSGRLAADNDCFDLLRAVFPAGTLSGAPKVRAMEIIDELENTRRGHYGGAVGYIGADGGMDLCIAIRTILMQGRRCVLQAGAGIVADSNPQREFEETLHKMGALKRAIEMAEEGL